MAGLSAMLPTISNLLVAGENTCHGVKADFALLLFPNPGKGEFSLKYLLEPKENATVQIYNYAGSLIKELTISEGTTRFNFTLNDEASGIYYYKFVTNNGKYQYGKFILNR